MIRELYDRAKLDVRLLKYRNIKILQTFVDEHKDAVIRDSLQHVILRSDFNTQLLSQEYHKMFSHPIHVFGIQYEGKILGEEDLTLINSEEHANLKHVAANIQNVIEAQKHVISTLSGFYNNILSEVNKSAQKYSSPQSILSVKSLFDQTYVSCAPSRTEAEFVEYTLYKSARTQSEALDNFLDVFPNKTTRKNQATYQIIQQDFFDTYKSRISDRLDVLYG